MNALNIKVIINTKFDPTIDYLLASNTATAPCLGLLRGPTELEGTRDANLKPELVISYLAMYQLLLKVQKVGYICF